MAKVVKSIRLSESMVKLLEDMGQFCNEQMGEGITTSKIYSLVLRTGIDDFWNQVEERLQYKDKANGQVISRADWDKWQELKLRGLAMQVSLDEELGKFFVDTYFDQREDKEKCLLKVNMKVKLEFDKSWQKRNKIELNWILEKCKIGPMIQTKEMGQSIFQKNAKVREGVLNIEMKCKRPLSCLWCVYYIKALLYWDVKFLSSYGIFVQEVVLGEEQEEKLNRLDNTHGTMGGENNVLNEHLKSMRIEEGFLELAQGLCDIETKLLGQTITLNGMLVSMLRQGTMSIIQMIKRLEKCVHNEIRIGGQEKEALSQWENWLMQ